MHGLHPRNLCKLARHIFFSPESVKYKNVHDYLRDIDLYLQPHPLSRVAKFSGPSVRKYQVKLTAAKTSHQYSCPKHQTGQVWNSKSLLPKTQTSLLWGTQWIWDRGRHQSSFRHFGLPLNTAYSTFVWLDTKDLLQRPRLIKKGFLKHMQHTTKILHWSFSLQCHHNARSFNKMQLQLSVSRRQNCFHVNKLRHQTNHWAEPWEGFSVTGKTLQPPLDVWQLLKAQHLRQVSWKLHQNRGANLQMSYKTSWC